MKKTLKDFGTSLSQLKKEYKAGNRIKQNHFGDFLMVEEGEGEVKYKVWLNHPDNVAQGEPQWQIEYFGIENGYTWTVIAKG